MSNLGKNKQLILAKHPNGLTEIDDFELKEAEVPEEERKEAGEGGGEKVNSMSEKLSKISKRAIQKLR